jgi:hypothetical protein
MLDIEVRIETIGVERQPFRLEACIHDCYKE